jgi:hypothetical protein
MLKSLVVIAVLAFAAPSLAFADDANGNGPAGNGPPGQLKGFDDPPTFNPPPPKPVVFGTFPGCHGDKDDRNGENGDDKNPGHGNPHCQPASP